MSSFSSYPTGSLTGSNCNATATTRSSQYAYRQLKLLGQVSTASPLRVVAHIDLDAFYAQCEMVRLGISSSQPLAVQQWDSLIAINYPARDFGITRMINASEARKLCPHITLQHVATFREGEGGQWAYRDDASKRVGTDKVSLDPYRGESRKILKAFKDELFRWREGLVSGNGDGGVDPQLQIQDVTVEKASVDEAFIDLSPLVYGVLLCRHPELRDTYVNDKTATLPPPPSTALEWNTEDHLVDLDENESEVDDPDWDDVALLIGSDIVRSLRAAVWRTLGYTCSAGVARNKMMAKLGSGCNKPNKQTVVRNRAIQNFLGGFKFTKMRMLGGKLGDQVSAVFGTEQVSDLLKVPLEQFRALFDDETAVWLYSLIRGDDRSEVNARTQMKSMLSAKSFRPSIKSIYQAERWLRIFVADIYGRLVEDGVLENRRRPRTLALHHRQGGQIRSRQISIPIAKPVDEALLLELAKVVLRQVAEDARTWNCENLSLSVGGFEEGVINNRAIDGFLVRGEEAKQLNQTSKDEQSTEQPLFNVKKRKQENNNNNDNGIRRFFKSDSNNGGNEKSLQEETQSWVTGRDDTNFFICNRCGKQMAEEERSEHDDWHIAKDLDSQERENFRSEMSELTNTRGNNNKSGLSHREQGKNRKRQQNSDKGQMRLNFG